MNTVKDQAIALLRAAIADLERDDLAAAVAHHASADVALSALADDLSTWTDEDREAFFADFERKDQANANR